MANRVSVEIDARVEGFQQGMNAATDSARKYETETQKIANATGNFRKELSKAKKDAQNLALGYAKLSKEAKASAFGKEMKRQLDEAKEAAAQYIDMQGDLQQELRNLASDTHTLDMLSEGMGTFMQTTSAALGVVAQFTGNEQDAQRAIVAFTTAESTLSAVTKIQNALQMQSNTMMAVTKIQTLAAAAAERIKTAATGQGIIATKAATIAQAAFNAVASANPYVLLATAIIGVATAIGVYVLATKDAETETDRENKRIAEAKQRWNEYKQKVAESAADMIAQYKALEAEWNALRTTEEKNKFLDDNKNKLHNMGLEIDDINELEDLFVRNSAAVVKALKARAEAEAWGEIYKERLKKKIEADLHGSVENNRYYRKAKAGDHISADEARRLGINTTVSYQGQTATTANMSGTYERGITAAEAVRVNALRNADALKRQREETKELNTIQDRYTQSTIEANQATTNLSHTLTHTNNRTHNGGGSGDHTDTKNELTELQKLEQEVQKYEEQLKNVQNPEAPSSQALIQGIQANLKKAREEVTKYKLAVGLEVEPSTLENMEAELKQKKLMLYADISQEDKDNIYQEILQLEDKIEKEKIKAHIIIDPEIEANNKIQQEIADIMGSINVQEKPKFDFSNIAEVDEGQAEMLNKLAAQYNRVYEAREELMKLMNESGASDNQIAAAQAALEQINPQLDTMLDKLNMFKDIDDAVGDAIKNTKKLQNSINKVGDALKACGDLFSALGDVGEDEGMKAMGIVAQAVATVALSFAQALSSCKTWVDWLAFGATGLATMLTMISQIKAATAGGYAEGGIVGGSSYAGDRLYARINSGEMILNSRQQRNLFNLLDTAAMPQRGGTNVQVQGVIRGTDLLLVQKNTNAVLKKAGSEIHF